MTADVMLIIRQIDALSRFRFRTDAEVLAAWRPGCRLAAFRQGRDAGREPAEASGLA